MQLLEQFGRVAQQIDQCTNRNVRNIDKGILEGAMTDDDARTACDLMKNCRIERVSTGHGFHIEDPKKFVKLARELIQDY